MKPAELINKFVEGFLVDELAELGFSYSRSKIRFTRKLENIAHRIEFSKSKWNQEGKRVEFWTIWVADSDYYATWHYDRYNLKPLNNLIISTYDKHLKEWNKDLMSKSGKYNLECGRPELVMEKLKWNFINVGIPLLNKYSTWESSANTIINEGKYKKDLINASDYFIIAGMKDKGYEPLIVAKEYFQTKNMHEPDPFFDTLLENIETRLKVNYSS